MNRDRIRCYAYREYNHFAGNCPNSREERDLEQLQHMLNKLINGRDDTATFLPLDSGIGGQSRDSHPTVGQYLIRDQARHIYKKVETGETINVDMVKHEIEQETQLNRMDDGSGEVNPYRELEVNNVEKVEM